MAPGTPCELVLTLHGIGEPHQNVGTDEAFVWVSSATYTTLLDNIMATRATADVPIVMTFDDGNASDATIALPELVRRGLKATFFVCAGRIGAPGYLDRVALHDLLQAGMEIGTHGMHHRDWRTLDDSALDVELSEARRRIEDACGRPVTAAAIPFGSYDRRVLGRLRRENFDCIYTSDGGLARSNACLKPRETLDATWQEADIRRALAASPPLKARLRRDAAMFYKALRRPPKARSLDHRHWKCQLNNPTLTVSDLLEPEYSNKLSATASKEAVPPVVSIIVINYRTRELTLECLRSVVRETRCISYEILLVDNASDDGLVEAVAEEMPDVRCLPLRENVGFARANNIAAEQARGKYLLLLNPDTLILDGAIDRLLDFAAERPDAKIWGGRTLFGDRSLNAASCWHRMTLWSVFCRTAGLAAAFPNSGFFNTEAYGGWDRSTVREVDIVSGCFLLIETEMWRSLDGFNPRFFMYGEEADLCLRARALGAKPTVTPIATIVHYGGKSPQVEAERMVRLLTAKAELIKRHFPAVSRWFGLILFALWPFFRVFQALLVSVVSGDRAEAHTCWEIWQRRAEWRRGLRLEQGNASSQGAGAVVGR